MKQYIGITWDLYHGICIMGNECAHNEFETDKSSPTQPLNKSVSGKSSNLRDYYTTYIHTSCG